MANCRDCGVEFKKKSRIRCNSCHNIFNSKYRYEWTVCQTCGNSKNPTSNRFCGRCFYDKYQRGLPKRKVNISNDDYRDLESLVWRIHYKQADFIFTFWDINDIIELWNIFGSTKVTKYDLMSSGEQIYHMWRDLVAVYNKKFNKSIYEKIPNE